MAKDNLDDFEDFFSSADDEPVAQPAQRPSVAPQQSTPTAPEPPVQKNDDDEDADDDVIVVKPHRWLKFIVIVAVVALLSVGGWFYYKYCSPYVVNAEKSGYILNIEKRGYMFTTFEGDMISEFAINDTSRVYQRDFSFSVENDSIASEIMKLQGSGKKVCVQYETYLGTLPWRGSSKNIVTGITLR
ncbi:MAG: hypothetical protein SPE65_08810 [Muribaculaceae bacterium]|nr:hypothetical protein [Bacteroidales bacterium]MDY5120062.1 hypothetical protein [Muribaculaceae bacterium]